MRPKSVRVKTGGSPGQLYTAEDQKSFSRISTSAEDTLIDKLIKAATVKAENYTRTVFLNTTFEAFYDEFPYKMYIPKGVVSGITSVSYYDTSNSLQTVNLANLDIDLKSKPAIIKANEDFTFPETYDRQNAVIVEYVAGYGADNTSVPKDILTAVKLFVGALYDGDRMDKRAGNAMPTAAETILSFYKDRYF